MKILLHLFVFSIFNFGHAQNGFQIKDAKKEQTSFSFKLVNNLIIIPITVNGIGLDFLLDTGVSETILFSLDDKNVNFKNAEKIKLTGLGENQDVEALKSIKNHLTLGHDLADDNHSIYIILDQDFNISPTIGVPINGIIGYHFFKNHPIEINYIKKKIIVYKNEKSIEKKKKKFRKEDIKIELNKPYLMADIEMTQEKRSSKMLLDTGNTDAIWLFPTLIPNFNYNRPNIDDFLGSGFSGDIYGKRSRIHGLYFGDFSFTKPLVAMPDETSIQHLRLVSDRKGSIGSEIMRRFTIIFDYQNESIYLKKNRNYSDDFHFDMSGLEIKQDGLTWQQDIVKVETKTISSASNEIIIQNGEVKSEFQYKFVLKPNFIIAGTRKDSPAQISGLQKGDVLVKIDNKKVTNLTLQKIQNILRSKEGDKITLEITRKGVPMTYRFRLIDPIPYQEQ